MLLAAPDVEAHDLPLHALAAALAESSVAVRMFGAGVPMPAAGRRRVAGGRGGGLPLGPGRRAPVDPASLSVIPELRPRPLLVLGGPGWLAGEPGGPVARTTRRCASTTWPAPCRRFWVASGWRSGRDSLASPRQLSGRDSEVRCGVADDLASLLAAGERAAFHGRPGAGVDPLQRAAAMAAEHNLPTESAAARWLLAVCQAAAGRFGPALDALDGLLPVTVDAPAERRIFGALGEATLASVYRQLGRHSRRGLTTRSLWR